MTERPQVLSETPALADPLSDFLDGMHLATTVLFRGEFREPWSVVTPASCDLALLLPLRTEQIIPFHVVVTGECFAELHEREPVRLNAGDAILLPYGDGHRLGGVARAAPVPISEVLPAPPWSDVPVVVHGGDGARASIICGFLQCDELRFHPILRHLPALLHMTPGTTAADAWLAGTMRYAATEATTPKAGSRSMLSRLTELMFVEILRKHIQGLSHEEVGWFAALKDPVTGAALRCLHAAPLQDWTVESLARRAGVSRTTLAERFKHFLDQPPMQYFAQWRLQLAAQQLKSSDQPIKTIADRAGYDSEAAFSRAFKRHFGASPSDWRRRQRSA